MDVNKITITGVDDAQTLSRIDRQLKSLILTPECTVPGSRGFGIPYEFVDDIPATAINEFAISLEEKVEEYIPGISIKEVEIVNNEIRLSINVEGSDES